MNIKDCWSFFVKDPNEINHTGILSSKGTGTGATLHPNLRREYLKLLGVSPKTKEQKINPGKSLLIVIGPKTCEKLKQEYPSFGMKVQKSQPLTSKGDLDPNPDSFPLESFDASKHEIPNPFISSLREVPESLQLAHYPSSNLSMTLLTPKFGESKDHSSDQSPRFGGSIKALGALKLSLFILKNNLKNSGCFSLFHNGFRLIQESYLFF
jgi:hypothetical protein